MVYEIMCKTFGTKAKSIGYYYYNQENAQRKCDELNNMLQAYYVQEIKMQDQLN